MNDRRIEYPSISKASPSFYRTIQLLSKIRKRILEVGEINNETNAKRSTL
jgi:hypothetical protein